MAPTNDAERRACDPETYDAMERLTDIVDALGDGLDGYVNQLGMCVETLYDPGRSYWLEQHGSVPSPDTLPEIRELLNEMLNLFATTADEAERLLQDRLQQLEQIEGDR